MTSLESGVLTFLANALWQAPLLVALSWAGAELFRRAPASYRHRLWLAALVLAFVSPLASAVRPKPGLVARAGQETGPAVLEGLLGGAERGVASVAKRLSAPPEYSLGRLGGAAAVAYLLFVLVKVVRLVRAWRGTGRLVRGADTAPASVAGAVPDCAAALGRSPEVRVSSEVAVPMTFGVRRPVIVLPSEFARTAAPEALRAALVHELSHVVRHDCAVNLASELLALPVSFHPAVRFLKRRLGGAREAACDEAAAAFVGRSSYARTLLEVARTSCRPGRFAGALGVLDGDGLEDRMKTILDGGHAMLGRRQATLGLAGLVLALVVASRLAAAAAVGVTTEAGPSDMVGRWTATMPEGDVKGQPAVDMTIALTPNGPDIALTLYRHSAAADGGKPVAEHPPVIQHGVKNGVLQFRTRVENFRLRPEDPPSPMEADWEFEVVGADAGELRFLRNSKLAADKAQGKAVPPPPPPLAMKRVSKP